MGDYLQRAVLSSGFYFEGFRRRGYEIVLRHQKIRLRLGFLSGDFPRAWLEGSVCFSFRYGTSKCLHCVKSISLYFSECHIAPRGLSEKLVTAMKGLRDLKTGNRANQGV